MINQFSKYLEQKLKEGLPGKEAHREVAPYRKVDFNENDILQAQKSSVLILFYLKESEIYTTLIQRTVYEGKHSGQIAFPGGKAEKYDANIVQTALREAQEEVGIISQSVTVIGQLSDVFIPVSNFHVVPVIGISNSHPIFNIEKREVESLIELNINQLINKPLTENNVKLSNQTTIRVPSFDVEGKIVWGATALMLNELKYILADWKV